MINNSSKIKIWHGISCHLWSSVVTSKADEVKKQRYEYEQDWVNWFCIRIDSILLEPSVHAYITIDTYVLFAYTNCAYIK